MFSSSVRRVARPPSAVFPAPTARHATPTTTLTGPSSGLVACRSQQRRRYSSSKPPVPPSDGSRGIDASSQTPTKDVSPSNAEKREGKTTKKRGKDGNGNKSKNEPYLNVPSVPSTQHLHPLDIHVASFFSIHRPMSITTSIPPNSNPDAFSAIFESKKQPKARANDVINTLSSAVSAIEGGSSKNAQAQRRHPSTADNDLRTAVTQASVSNAESSMSQLDGMSGEQLRSSIQEFAKTLQPFNPPPAPVPMGEEAEGLSSSTSVEAGADEAEVEVTSSPREQNYSTVLTIRESNHSDGSKSYDVFTTPFVRVDELEAPSGVEDGKVIENGGERTQVPTRFLDRMRLRQLQWERVRQRQQGERTMHAISVRRQRKLKMKKHKRKKLLRRTRTLRHKLGKA